MTSPIFNNEDVNLLHALRSRSVNVKNNFSSIYKNDRSCPLWESDIDDQPDLLSCTVLTTRMKSKEAANYKVVYRTIFAEAERSYPPIFTTNEDYKFIVGQESLQGDSP